MASHFVSLNRSQEGLRLTDYVTGTASSGNVGIELRVDDGVLTYAQALLAIESFRNCSSRNPHEFAPSGFVSN